MKISLRRISNLFQRKDKNYSSEIKYSGDIDSQILSAYDNDCLSSVYMYIRYDPKDTKTKEDLNNLMNECIADGIQSISNKDTIIFYGLVSSFLSLITIVNNPVFENNKILNCIYNEFKGYPDTSAFIFDNEYVMKSFDTIENVLHQRQDYNSETPISIIALETVGNSDFEEVLGEKSVLQCSFMDFIVPEEIFSELFLGEALYLYDYDLKNDEKCYFCRMSTLSFLSVLFKNSSDNCSKVLKSVQSIINGHDYFEFTGNKDYSNFGYIIKTLGLPLELSEEDYESNDDLYKDIDEIID